MLIKIPQRNSTANIFLNPCLTNLCQMDFPIFINWTSSFPIKGLSGGIFHFYSNCNRTLCKQTLETLLRHRILQANIGDPIETLHSAASDLGLHCLYMSHKKDTRLIWVKYLFC